MCNQIIHACAEEGTNFFAIVSSDLAAYIPARFPQMLDRLRTNPILTSVGIAVQGIHDLSLLDRVSKHGIQEVSTDNYATIFHNNAFAIHRLHPIVGETALRVADRLFPRVTDQGKLGTIELSGQTMPIGGNEEIALALSLLRDNQAIDTLLLAGSHTIVRDPNQEISSVDAKILRRSAVARAYQNHYGVGDDTLRDYLHQHYQIAFS